MTDLEMVKRCAERMGLKLIDLREELGLDEDVVCIVRPAGTTQIYDPLHDDAQCMALVKKFALNIMRVGPSAKDVKWYVDSFREESSGEHESDLNRAIVECVARLP